MGTAETIFSGVKIQKATSNFILYCHSKKLVIEIDGSIHDLKEMKIKDELRQTELEALG